MISPSADSARNVYRGARVTLRALEERDLTSLAMFVSDTEAMKSFFGYIRLPWTEKDVRDRFLSSEWNPHFGIFDEQGEFIGIFGIHLAPHYARHGTCRYSICIRSDRQGKGYGLESSRVMLHVLFSQLGVYTVYGMFLESNLKRHRQMDQLGAKLCGTIRRIAYFDGRFHDGAAWFLDRASFYEANPTLCPMSGEIGK